MNLHYRHRHPDATEPRVQPSRAERIAAQFAADCLETIRCLAEEAKAKGGPVAETAVYIAHCTDARQWCQSLRRGGLLLPHWISQHSVFFEGMGWL